MMAGTGAAQPLAYNDFLAQRLEQDFQYYIYPDNFLIVVKGNNNYPHILSEQNIDRLRLLIDSKSQIRQHINSNLLDVLKRGNPNWFQLMLSVLRDKEIQLDFVAERFEQYKRDLDNDINEGRVHIQALDQKWMSQTQSLTDLDWRHQSVPERSTFSQYSTGSEQEQPSRPRNLFNFSNGLDRPILENGGPGISTSNIVFPENLDRETGSAQTPMSSQTGNCPPHHTASLPTFFSLAKRNQTSQQSTAQDSRRNSELNYPTAGPVEEEGEVDEDGTNVKYPSGDTDDVSDGTCFDNEGNRSRVIWTDGACVYDAGAEAEEQKQNLQNKFLEESYMSFSSTQHLRRHNGLQQTCNTQASYGRCDMMPRKSSEGQANTILNEEFSKHYITGYARLEIGPEVTNVIRKDANTTFIKREQNNNVFFTPITPPVDLVAPSPIHPTAPPIESIHPTAPPIDSIHSSASPTHVSSDASRVYVSSDESVHPSENSLPYHGDCDRSYEFSYDESLGVMSSTDVPPESKIYKSFAIPADPREMETDIRKMPTGPIYKSQFIRDEEVPWRSAEEKGTKIYKSTFIKSDAA